MLFYPASSSSPSVQLYLLSFPCPFLILTLIPFSSTLNLFSSCIIPCLISNIPHYNSLPLFSIFQGSNWRLLLRCHYPSFYSGSDQGLLTQHARIGQHLILVQGLSLASSQGCAESYHVVVWSSVPPASSSSSSSSWV